MRCLTFLEFCRTDLLFWGNIKMSTLLKPEKGISRLTQIMYWYFKTIFFVWTEYSFDCSLFWIAYIRKINKCKFDRHYFCTSEHTQSEYRISKYICRILPYDLDCWKLTTTRDKRGVTLLSHELSESVSVVVKGEGCWGILPFPKCPFLCFLMTNDPSLK